MHTRTFLTLHWLNESVSELKIWYRRNWYADALVAPSLTLLHCQVYFCADTNLILDESISQNVYYMCRHRAQLQPSQWAAAAGCTADCDVHNDNELSAWANCDHYRCYSFNYDAFNLVEWNFSFSSRWEQPSACKSIRKNLLLVLSWSLQFNLNASNTWNIFAGMQQVCICMHVHVLALTSSMQSIYECEKGKQTTSTLN